MTNIQSKPKTYFLGIFLAIIGILLSIFLIQEFFGTSNTITAGLCSATGDGNSCQKVAASSFSGIRNVPLLGGIPVALFGFLYYCFSGYLLWISYHSKDEQEKISSIRLLFLLSSFGLIIDLVLLLISVAVIQTVCILCLLTYFVTIGLLITSLIILRKIAKENAFNDLVSSSMNNIKQNFLNYLIIFLAFTACGIGVGQYSQSHSLTTSNAARNSEIQMLIQEYENGPTVKIDLTDTPSIGSDSATVTIVKYADFNCGHCMHASQILRVMLSEFGSALKVYYKNFPLDGNCNRFVGRKLPNASSCVAASAALCGQEQDKFKEMYHGIYADNEKGIMHSPSSVLQVAKKHKLNLSQFRSCMSSPKIRQKIEKEVEESNRLKIESTPTLFINNKPIRPGTPDIRYLRALIKHLIQKA